MANLTIGKNYLSIKKAIADYKLRLVKYVESQKEEGYLSIVNDENDGEDTMRFKMGQNTFLIQMTALNPKRAIVLKTYKMPRFPEREIRVIPEYEILITSASDQCAGIAQFKTPQALKVWDKVQEINYLEDFNPEYFYFLDNHIERIANEDYK